MSWWRNGFPSTGSWGCRSPASRPIVRASGSGSALQRLARVRTIDLRIDYLDPATADVFTASASVLRAGGRVVVARMDLREEGGGLVAVGTGTYTVG